MFEPIHIALYAALIMASIAAVCDGLTGQIPNWLTLPGIVFPPLIYGSAFGFEQAARCIAATLVSAFVPYVLFRRAAMGGGDVKLFAALGAIAGFDLLAGLEIQLVAFGIGLFMVLAGMAWKRSPFRWPRKNVASSNAHSSRSLDGEPSGHATQRMGGAILLATVVFSFPYF